MSVKYEKLENNAAKLTIEVSPEKFEEGMDAAYKKNKNRITVPGFRKGKAPRKIIEKMYGAGVFYEDAANAIIPEAYEEAYKEVSSELEIVSRPAIDVTQIGEGQAFIFTAEVALAPTVELGEYKGIEVAKVTTEATEEEIADELKKVQEANSRTVDVTDRAVENGDIATIDFEGFIDDVAFDGGKGTDYKLTIGSHSFIDTFEDQIIGHSIGDEFDVNVTFPEEYGAKELAGKPAVFKVAVKAISQKEYPELDDEFASEVSDFDTLDAYKENLKKEIAERKSKEGQAAKEDEAVKKLVEASKVSYSDQQVKDMAENMLSDMKRNMQQQGISMEMYLLYTGMTENQLLEQNMPRAEERIKSRAVLLAVAEKEAITVSEEEMEKKLSEIAEQYKMDLEKVKDILGEQARKDIEKDMKVEKAVDLIVEAAKEV